MAKYLLILFTFLAISLTHCSHNIELGQTNAVDYYTPIVILHGINDDCISINHITEKLYGLLSMKTKVTCIEIGNGKVTSMTSNLND
jgi:hypothetical protein